ncbi:MAG: hypothetical protein ACPLRZ_01620 [Thermovenabulum sp.]|uniref:hypothetical protein n=1 Tax=Thermovenabulum sp. TaxID=3100335 RepID=UPI003C79B0A8
MDNILAFIVLIGIAVILFYLYLMKFFKEGIITGFKKKFVEKDEYNNQHADCSDIDSNKW